VLSESIEFCNGLLEQGINVQWMCETRVDSLDRELIGLMHQAGCVAFYIGVESGSQRVLDFLRKGITTEQIEAVFRWCNEIGVNTYASFIVGVPTETPEERQLSREFARKIQATTAWFNIFVGIPKSPLYEYVLEHDLYEYIDDVGLVYMKGHDALVDQFYGEDFRRRVPIPSHYRRSQELLLLGKRRESLLALFRTILQHPLRLEFWKFLLVSFVDRRVVSLLRRIKHLF